MLDRSIEESRALRHLQPEESGSYELEHLASANVPVRLKIIPGPRLRHLIHHRRRLYKCLANNAFLKRLLLPGPPRSPI